MPRYGNEAPEGDDANRHRLFGNRTGNPYSSQGGGHAARGSESSQNGGYGGAPASYSSGTGYGSSYGYTQQSQYQGYGQSGASRSQVDDSEQEVEDLKGQMKSANAQAAASSQRALDAAERALESGEAIANSLQTQGDHLANTEQNLNTTGIQNRIAEERTRELKHANRGLLSVNPKGLFRSKGRARDEEARILARNQLEREERDRTRKFGYDSKNVVERGPDTTVRVEGKGKSSDTERSRHQFEPDSEDDRVEDTINDNLGKLESVTARLKGMAITSGKVVERQNEQIDRIMKKSDRVDDQITLNKRQLDKIR